MRKVWEVLCKRGQRASQKPALLPLRLNVRGRRELKQVPARQYLTVGLAAHLMHPAQFPSAGTAHVQAPGPQRNHQQEVVQPSDLLCQEATRKATSYFFKAFPNASVPCSDSHTFCHLGSEHTVPWGSFFWIIESDANLISCTFLLPRRQK